MYLVLKLCYNVKTMYTQRKQKISLLRGHEVPAVKAALFVIILLIAALARMGAIIVLLVARVMTETSLLSEHSAFLQRLRKSMCRALPDIALLLIGLFFQLYGSFLLAGTSGLRRSALTVLVGFGVLLPSALLLWRSLHTLFSSEQITSALRKKRRSFNAHEKLWLALIGAVGVALLIAPLLLGISFASLGAMLLHQMFFWKI